MKILYVTDIHGDKWKYEQTYLLAKTLKVNIVLNGGDMLPLKGNLLKQDKFIINYLDDYLSKFNADGIYYITMLANDDLIIFDGLFQKICDKYQYIINIAQKRFNINNYEFIGMNWIPDFPFVIKDRARKDTKDFIFPKQLGTPLLSTQTGWNKIENWFSYVESLPTIEDEINSLVTSTNLEKTVYLIHTPPSNLSLDVCYDGKQVGSKAIYNFLKLKQPLISFHGHIHESPEISGKWYSYLDKTLCIQPGQSHASQNYLIYVVVQLEKMKFERYKFTKSSVNN